MKSADEIEVRLSTIVLETSQWSQKEYHLDDIVREFELPQLAKISGVTSSGSDLAKKLDIDRAFLIYSRRRRTKVSLWCCMVSM